MSKEKVKRTNTYRIGCIVLIAMLVVIMVFWYTSAKLWFTPTHKEETKLSSTEQQYILSLLAIESDCVTVEKVEFSHAREHVFWVYISGLTEKDLEDEYTPDEYEPMYYTKNTTVFPDTMKCEFIEENGERTAKFTLCLYDERLYEMVE